MRASEVGLLRLVAQRLAGPPAPTPPNASSSADAASGSTIAGLRNEPR